MNFIKYGFKQTALDNSIEKRFEALDKRFESIDKRFEALDQKIEVTTVNHFGHLKNYLGVLNWILLDKNIISNQEKARLDNELRGM